MKKILIVMTILCLMPFAVQAGAQLFMFENPMLGKIAEDFSLPNLDGEEMSLNDLRGDETAIVFFWATWCPHCRTNLAELHENAQEIKEKGVNIVLVDLGESSMDVQAYLDRHKMDFEVLLDQKGEVANLYAVQGIPTFIYIDDSGTVKAVEHEFLDDYEEVLGL